MTAVIDDVWPFFLVPTKVVLSPTVVTVDGETTSMTPVIKAQVLVWAVPWPQLILVAGIALLILALVWGRRRNKRRLRGMLAEAREEGRRSADEIGTPRDRAAPEPVSP
jgi:LPXTG-motif cell wall-anchored protein